MNTAFTPARLRAVLADLGRLLPAGEPAAAIVVVGGAALSLGGVVDRATVDVDVVAVGDGNTVRPPGQLVIPARLPEAIEAAAARLARDLGLPHGWLNTAVTMGGTLVLPAGFEARIQWESFGGLWVGLAGRADLIALKLHAAVDTDVRSRHYRDLLALAPTPDELAEAAVWVRGQDAGEGFATLVTEVIAHVRADLA